MTKKRFTIDLCLSFLFFFSATKAQDTYHSGYAILEDGGISDCSILYNSSTYPK